MRKTNEAEKNGMLSIVLHAHMPYVINPYEPDSLEERWLYEAITDCYLRLFLAFDNLIKDNIPFRFIISLSPPLISQLQNPIMPHRYLIYLDRLIELSKNETHRTKNMPKFQKLAKMYLRYYEKIKDLFLNRCKKNIINVFKEYAKMGYIDLITSSATHAYLPLFKSQPTIIWAQIKIAIEYFNKIFGYKPKGMWLPECGYFPELNELLSRAGIGYFFLDTKVFQGAMPTLQYGIYAPFFTQNGIAIFGRNEQTGDQVWNSLNGYPGDYDCREYYRDIGYDLDMDYIKPYLLKGKHRTNTGIKYYRVTGPNNKKEPYDPYKAQRQVEVQVDDFLSNLLHMVRDLHLGRIRKPIFCALYDAELFGHWWFEGPSWLETLCRKIANDCRGYISLCTPMDYLRSYPVNQVAAAPGGSWGWGGNNEVWLNKKNDWLYPHLFKAGEKMMALAHLYHRGPYDPPDKIYERALNQAARELLIAQSSDWPFIINNNTLPLYAQKRFKQHIGRFWKLANAIEDKNIDPEWLAQAEECTPIFPNLSFRVYNPK